jgi:hypothetical protein
MQPVMVHPGYNFALHKLPMQAPKVPFVSLASPFTPSGNTVLVTGGASGIDEFNSHLILPVPCLH